MDSNTHSAFGRLEIVETGRRRRWSDDEKCRIVMESVSGPRQVSATARRHGVSRSQLLTWRRKMVAEAGPIAPGFVPVVFAPDEGIAAPAPSPSAAQPRLEVVLCCGRRIIAEGAVDTDAVLKLARGLEALR